MLRVAAIVTLLIGLLVLAVGCGDDDEGSDGSDVAAVDVERYCELVDELDRAGQEQFEELEADPDATRADFEAAEREFLENQESEIEELQEAAPDEIAGETSLVIEATRARAGLVDEVPAGERRAEEQIREFEKKSC